MRPLILLSTFVLAASPMADHQGSHSSQSDSEANTVVLVASGDQSTLLATKTSPKQVLLPSGIQIRHKYGWPLDPMPGSEIQRFNKSQKHIFPLDQMHGSEVPTYPSSQQYSYPQDPMPGSEISNHTEAIGTLELEVPKHPDVRQQQEVINAITNRLGALKMFGADSENNDEYLSLQNKLDEKNKKLVEFKRMFREQLSKQRTSDSGSQPKSPITSP